MSSRQLSGDLISDRYASALYALSLESKNVEIILKELELVQTLQLDHLEPKFF